MQNFNIKPTYISRKDYSAFEKMTVNILNLTSHAYVIGNINDNTYLDKNREI